MTHLEIRLAERDIHVSQAQISGLCYEYECAAVILSKQGSHHGPSNGDFYGRSESNGDLVVLIIRDHQPVTIMYRRSNQNNTPSGLRVDELIDLTQ